MRYAIYLFAVIMVLMATTASPVLACNGHGAAVAAAINDFFSGQGNAGASGSGGGYDGVNVNGNVNGNAVNGYYEGNFSGASNSGSAAANIVNAFLGTSGDHGHQNISIDLDYNG